MRRILLAVVTLACLAPAAEAARNERDKASPGSRPAQQQAAKAEPGKSGPAQARSQAASRPAAAPRQQQAARAPARQPAAQRFSALRPGDVRTSRSGLVVRGAAAATVSREPVANCTRRNGRVVCGGGGSGSGIAGWQNGLPTVNYAQRECPDGTFATLARGHDDVVRCMPL